MDADADVTALVFDTGSTMSKIGIAGDDAPRAVFSSICGRPKYVPQTGMDSHYTLYLGDQAVAKRGALKLSHPLERGNITDVDDLSYLWDYSFRMLAVNPKEHPVLLNDSLPDAHRNRELMVQLMFEKFEVPATFISVAGILAAYASGRCTSMQIGGGDSFSTIPIYEGYTVKNAIQKRNFGGIDMTRMLMSRLCEQPRLQSIFNDNSAGLEIAREIKEATCCVSKNYQRDIEQWNESKNVPYTLPDGQVISVGPERIMIAEALFQPHLFGLEGKGIHELLFDAVMSCDIDMRKDLFGNFCVYGGSTMMPGFADRLRREMLLLAPRTMRVKVMYVRDIRLSLALVRFDSIRRFESVTRTHSEAPERKYSVWIGGSILASLSTFQRMWISSKEYDEHGPWIVHQKCFGSWLHK